MCIFWLPIWKAILKLPVLYIFFFGSGFEHLASIQASVPFYIRINDGLTSRFFVFLSFLLSSFSSFIHLFRFSTFYSIYIYRITGLISLKPLCALFDLQQKKGSEREKQVFHTSVETIAHLFSLLFIIYQMVHTFEDVEWMSICTWRVCVCDFDGHLYSTQRFFC